MDQPIDHDQTMTSMLYRPRLRCTISARVVVGSVGLRVELTLRVTGECLVHCWSDRPVGQTESYKGMPLLHACIVHFSLVLVLAAAMIRRLALHAGIVQQCVQGIMAGQLRSTFHCWHWMHLPGPMQQHSKRRFVQCIALDVGAL